MTSLSVPLPYPLVPADEHRAINRLAIAVALVGHKLTKEYSIEWLETELCRCLAEGRLSIAIKAVEAANLGDEIADGALRLVGAELQMPLLQGRDLAPGHLQIIAYLQRVAQRAPHKRKQGRYHWSDHWYRNIEICILIHLACAEFGVRAMRNRESRRANRNPSGISLITAALARNKVHLEEKTIQNKIWCGLPGELAERIIVQHPIETWFR